MSFEMCHKKATAVTRASIFIYTCIRASFAKNRFSLYFACFSHSFTEKVRKFPLSRRRHALTRIHTCISLQRRFAFCNSKVYEKVFQLGENLLRVFVNNYEIEHEIPIQMLNSLRHTFFNLLSFRYENFKMHKQAIQQCHAFFIHNTGSHSLNEIESW